MKRLPCFFLIFVAILLVAAEKKDEKSKEPTPSAAQIQLWVKQLGDDSYHVREEATRNLIKAGVNADAAVSVATKSEDAEVRQRALMIIKQIGKQLEKAASTYFKKIGGKVWVDENSPDNPMIGLYLYQIKVTDLTPLEGLTNLEILRLVVIPVSDLSPLKSLTNLKELRLVFTQANDLSPLEGLSNLKKLDLWGTPVTDLSPLASLTNLKSLQLDETKVKDLAPLKRLTNLRDLALRNTQVKDLSPLKGLTNLWWLDLKDTPVSKEEVLNLKKALPDCAICWDGD